MLAIQRNLENMGLSKPEASVYLAALKVGRVLPKHLAEKAGIKRPTLYDVLPKLMEAGLLSAEQVGKRRYLVAEDPEIFVEKKRYELSEIDRAVPALRALLMTAVSKPSMVTYEGTEGLKKVYLDNLREQKPTLELVGIERIEPEVERYIKHYYIPERVKRRIPLKMLISGSPKAGLFNLATNEGLLREVRTISAEQCPVPLDCNIYGDSVSFAVYRSDSQPVGVIIRSREIATTVRSMFTLLWEQGTPVVKPL